MYVFTTAGVLVLLVSLASPRLAEGQGADLSVDISNSLLALLTEEQTIRNQLESQLNDLGAELNSLQALQNNVTCECSWHQNPIAFWAVLSHDIASLGTRQQIRFDKLVTNIGGGYDDRHGEFRAPVDGTYEFSVSMLMNPGHWAGVEIVRDNTPVAKARTGDDAKWSMATAVVTLYMKAGQDVWVEHIAESDNALIYGQDTSAFSGHLIQS